MFEMPSIEWVVNLHVCFSGISFCIMCINAITIAGLQNDHKDIMRQIESKLHELHARSSSANAVESPMEVNGEQHAVGRAVFARIDHVDEGSPAAAAVSHRHTHSHLIYLFTLTFDQHHNLFVTFSEVRK